MNPKTSEIENESILDFINHIIIVEVTKTFKFKTLHLSYFNAKKQTYKHNKMNSDSRLRNSSTSPSKALSSSGRSSYHVKTVLKKSLA